MLWSISFAIGFAVVYGLNLPKRFGGDSDVATLDELFVSPSGPPVENLSLAASAIYGGFHRFAWAVAIGWVVFACCRGYGGNVRSTKYKSAYRIINCGLTISFLCCPIANFYRMDQ